MHVHVDTAHHSHVKLQIGKVKLTPDPAAFECVLQLLHLFQSHILPSWRLDLAQKVYVAVEYFPAQKQHLDV